MSLPPPQGDDPIITQFRPVQGQWELTEDNINRIDPKNGQSILHNYCQHINTTPLAVYRYLIETLGCDVNAQDKYNDTPLHYAIYSFNPRYSCDITVLAYLINLMGVNVNIKDKYGYTFLHKACENINTLPLDIFKLLIETLGGDVNAQANNKNTPLHNALRDFDPNRLGDVNVLIYLLSQKGINVNIKNYYGYTLLHIACLKPYIFPLDIFKLLIETMGCDVNAQNTYNDTPLHNALRNFDWAGDITVLMYLLSQKGVNVNIKDLNGDTVLHRGCKNINNLPLEIFKLLIETQGCDINAQDNSNNTPLHHALRFFNLNDRGDLTVLTYLLSQKGVNVNIEDQIGCTLVHLVCGKINSLPLEIFKVLIETHGADLNAQTNNKDTPIHLAFHGFDANAGPNLTVLTYLLSQKGVNGNIKDKYGETLLHYACKRINSLPLDVFKVLIETHGADINARNKDNHTPIHLAFHGFHRSHGGHIAVLAYLLSQNGVNSNIKDKCGDTFLHMVCRDISVIPLKIVQHLIETHGSDVNVQNTYNDTPIHNAFRGLDLNNENNTTVFAYIKNQNGCTFLHLTCTRDISDLIKVSDSVNVPDSNDDWNVLEAKCGTVLSHIVEMTAERCVERIVDEFSS
jgi:ankyrin repeat protein